MGGTLGGIIGAVIGLVGGALGTYISIRNTKTPAQRAFMIKGSLIMWTSIALLLAELHLTILGLVPRWVFWTSAGAFWLLLMLAIPWENRRLRQLRGRRP